MRSEARYSFAAFFVAIILSASNLYASCSTSCANGSSSSSDIPNCDCCCKNGQATCGADGTCPATITLEFEATDQELSRFGDYIQQLRDTGVPELLALAEGASSVHLAVTIKDHDLFAEANAQYLEKLSNLSVPARLRLQKIEQRTWRQTLDN